MQKISLSNNTVSRRIFEIAKINASHSFYELKRAVNLPFSLISRRKYGISYVISEVYLQCNNEFTRIHCFVNHRMGVLEMNIFQKCNDFFTEVELFWTDCVGACTDGAAAMIGHTTRFYARVQSANDTPITFTHFLIHREALVAKTMSRALTARIFANLCGEMESEFTTLLLHC